MPWIQIEGKSSAQVERSPRSSPDGLGCAVIVISVAGVLAMVTTWFLDAYFPIPDDEAVYFGLLGFLFVLFITLPFAALKFLGGRGIASVKSSLSLLLLGLFTALVVGSLPLLWRRLTAAIPWAQDIPFTVPLMLWLTANELLRRQSLAQERHRYSWKKLIFQGGLLIFLVTSNLAFAAFKLSDGKAWLGAFYLAVALLLGVPAINVFVEIWRRRRERR
jgi:hypothetical protein